MGRGSPERSRSAASASSPSGRVNRRDSTSAAAMAATITAAPSPRTRAWVSGSATTAVGTPTTSTAATVSPTMVSRSRRRIRQPATRYGPAVSVTAPSLTGPSVAALEPEADPAHGGDVPGTVRVVAELAAKPGDVHVQRLGRRPPLGVPDLAHDLLPGHHLARVPQQDPPQVELLCGEVELGVAVPGPARLGVAPDAAYGARPLRRPPPQQG